MSSIVDVVAHKAPSIMIIEAMTRTSKRADLLKHFGVPKIPLNGQHVEVCLTINGVEVDFIKTAQEMWERLAAKHNEDVLLEAQKLVNRSRLSRLNDIMERAEHELEAEIEALFKKGKRK